MDEKITLKKVNKIGERAFDVFEMDDKTINFVESTPEKYALLANHNPINPTIKDGKWLYSFKKNHYDTPSGELEENCYVEENEKWLVKHQDCLEPFSISKDKLEADSVSEEVVADMNVKLEEKLNGDSL